MKRLGLIIAAAFLLFAPAAQAANSTVAAMTAGAAFADTDLLYCVQSAGTLDRKCTPLQMAAYVYGKMSGDATTSGTGTFTLATVNANVGAFGSTTNCGSFTVNAKGLVTAASQAACAPPITAVTGWGTGALAAAQAALNGSTGLVGALTPTNNNCVVGNGSAWTSAACPGAVSSVTGGIGVTVSPTTGAVVVSAPATRRDNTATTDTITSSDKGTVVTESNASAVAVAITTAGFVTTDYFTVKNIGVGTATYTPSSGTVDGATTLVCKTGQSADLYFDGTNYKTLANTCGQALTIASGTAALGTGAITSATCATVVTATATGTVTTDVLTASFNGDPTAVTGYVPATAGMLTIIAYPTANTANFKVCNNTSSSITPGAITLNWRVVR